jgi:hypothetical protein
MAVGTDPEHDCVESREFIDGVRESVQFGGAHIGEIEGVEEQHDILA